jgi:hypothetical protein
MTLKCAEVGIPHTLISCFSFASAHTPALRAAHGRPYLCLSSCQQFPGNFPPHTPGPEPRVTRPPMCLFFKFPQFPHNSPHTWTSTESGICPPMCLFFRIPTVSPPSHTHLDQNRKRQVAIHVGLAVQQRHLHLVVPGQLLRGRSTSKQESYCAYALRIGSSGDRCRSYIILMGFEVLLCSGPEGLRNDGHKAGIRFVQIGL